MLTSLYLLSLLASRSRKLVLDSIRSPPPVLSEERIVPRRHLPMTNDGHAMLIDEICCISFKDHEECHSDLHRGNWRAYSSTRLAWHWTIFNELAINNFDAYQATALCSSFIYIFADIMIKPDGVQRGLIGEIISRFEQKGYKLVAMKLTAPGREHMEKHYADLSSKGFFAGLISYMTSGPVCAMVWEGKNVVLEGRKMLGATMPSESAMGTIR